MMKRLIALLLLPTFIISGCSPYTENNKIEEIAPVIMWSITDSGNGKMKISTLMPPLVQEKKRFLSTNVTMLKQGEKRFNLNYFRELKAGQLRILLISEDIATKGLFPILHTVQMDTEISDRLFLIIVKGDFEAYVRKQLKDQPNLDYFLYRMLKHYENNNQGEMTIVNFHEFMKKYYSPYSDPILPVFKATSANFDYKGTALFDDDKLQTVVTKIDDQIMQILNHDHYVKYLSIPKLSVLMGRVRTNTRIKMKDNNSTCSIQIEINGRLEEANINSNNEPQLSALESKMEKYLEQQTLKLLKKLQTEKVDPLNMGRFTSHPFQKPISKEQWLKYWENMKFDVSYKVNFIS